jgi:hypothetical protein
MQRRGATLCRGAQSGQQRGASKSVVVLRPLRLLPRGCSFDSILLNFARLPNSPAP